MALFSALSSLLTGRHVRSDTAMTGEISLRGLVLPIGGVKEKTAAAVRAGIARVILPERNRKDLEDVSPDVRGRLEFIFASDVSDVLGAALEPQIAGDGAAAARPESGNNRPSLQ